MCSLPRLFLQPILHSWKCSKIPTKLYSFTTDGKISFKNALRDVEGIPHHAKPLLDATFLLGIDDKPMLKLITRRPRILMHDVKKTSKIVSLLMEFGFEPNHITSMLYQYPDLLAASEDDIMNNMRAWRTGGLAERFLIPFFGDFPKLLCVSNDQVLFRLKDLRNMFQGGTGRIKRALTNSPDIMFQDWSQVRLKFKYCYKVMRVKESEICRSKVLSHSLDHLKLRHAFLEKAGMYKRPSAKDDDGYDPFENPKLTVITDTSDENFAKNVAKVSPDEFQVYQKLKQMVSDEFSDYEESGNYKYDMGLDEDEESEDYISDDEVDCSVSK